jgi:Ni/Co efflux regulator RcnB
MCTHRAAIGRFGAGLKPELMQSRQLCDGDLHCVWRQRRNCHDTVLWFTAGECNGPSSLRRIAFRRLWPSGRRGKPSAKHWNCQHCRPPVESLGVSTQGQQAARPTKAVCDHRGAADSSSSRGSRGAGPDHNIYPGSKLPSYYHNYRIYVVDDWRAHHLSAPPRGHHWVQTGADYVLVAIVSGEVKQVLVVD